MAKALKKDPSKVSVESVTAVGKFVGAPPRRRQEAHGNFEVAYNVEADSEQDAQNLADQVQQDATQIAQTLAQELSTASNNSVSVSTPTAEALQADTPAPSTWGIPGFIHTHEGHSHFHPEHSHPSGVHGSAMNSRQAHTGSSVEARIALGITLPLGFLLICGAVLAIWRPWRRKQTPSPTSSPKGSVELHDMRGAMAAPIPGPSGLKPHSPTPSTGSDRLVVRADPVTPPKVRESGRNADNYALGTAYHRSALEEVDAETEHRL